MKKNYLLNLLFVYIFSVLSVFVLLINKSFAVIHNPEIQNFISAMVEKHNFNQNYLESLFSTYKPNQEILQKIAHPSEKLNWGQYKKLLISADRIQKGKIFLQKNNNILLKAEEHFGVPKEIIVAILGVESFYGAITGKFLVLDALTTLAFDYPPRQKFFKSELEHFLLLIQEEKLDPLAIKGSYAGAMSPAQFISSSYRAYAVDFAHIGTKDLNNMHNAIGSIANYFYKHGWQKNGKIAVKLSNKNINKNNNNKNLLEFISEHNNIVNTEYWESFNNFNVITKYNHSNNYAMAVYQLAMEFSKLKRS